jgi:hypothetical protein
MRSKWYAMTALLLAGLILSGSLRAGEARSAEVMVVGTFHMGGSGDYIRVEGAGVESDERQREIEEVVERLARYRPTRIAVEVDREADDALNSRYQLYRKGERPLGPSETEQIGFRLAERLGHERLYAVDYRKDENIGAIFEHAAAIGEAQFLGRAQAAIGSIMADTERRQKSLTIREILLELNSPAEDSLHGLYLLVAALGKGDDYKGADLVAVRYERNLKIFANIARIARPDDRIVAIYGSSHGKLLRQFVEESPDLHLVRVEPYLAD